MSSLFRGPIPLLLALSLLSAGPTAAEETRYVTDQYEFNLRSGQSTRYKILRQLTSGTPVSVLSVDNESGYSRVRTEDGLSGYILTRYLQDEPAARSQLDSMRAQLDALQQEPDKLASRLSSLQAEHERLKTEAVTLQREKQDLEAALVEVRKASANALQIDRERRELQEQVSALLLQVDQLEHQNLELSNENKQKWFLIGGGVLSGGLLLGLLLPNLRLRRRRSSSWGGGSAL
jgi:SH3 domain protein